MNNRINNNVIFKGLIYNSPQHHEAYTLFPEKITKTFGDSINTLENLGYDVLVRINTETKAGGTPVLNWYGQSFYESVVGIIKKNHETPLYSQELENSIADKIIHQGILLNVKEQSNLSISEFIKEALAELISKAKK